MNGWIKLHRKMTEWEWYTDTNTKALFLHLLLVANHEDVKYKGIVVKKGEHITGLEKLAKETGLTIRQVRTAINHLKTTHDVTCNVTSKGTVIRIVNWGKYQCLDFESDKQNDTQCDKRVTTNNKYKKKEYIYNTDTLPIYDTKNNVNLPKEEAEELLKIMGKA